MLQAGYASSNVMFLKQYGLPIWVNLFIELASLKQQYLSNGLQGFSHILLIHFRIFALFSQDQRKKILKTIKTVFLIKQ